MAKLRAFGPAEGRAVLALHCSLAHGGAWDGVWRQAPELRLLAPDLPGHGLEPLWDGTGDVHDIATAQISALAQAHGPVDVMGHSFGGTVALRLAMERPDLVRSLTLIEPVVFAAARNHPIYPVLEAQQQENAALYAEGAHEAATQAFLGIWGDGRPFETLPPHLRSYMVARMPMVLAQNQLFAGDVAGLMAPGGLERLDMPVMLLEGALSPPVVGVIHEALLSRLGQAKRVVVPGATHMLPITHPAEVAKALRDNLARLPIAA